MDSPIGIDDEQGSAALAPATSPFASPPRKKVRGDGLGFLPLMHRGPRMHTTWSK